MIFVRGGFVFWKVVGWVCGVFFLLEGCGVEDVGARGGVEGKGGFEGE